MKLKTNKQLLRFMNKRPKVLFLMLATSLAINAQEATLEWALNPIDSNSTSNFQEGRSVAIDTDRSSYITGHFSGTVDFDPSTATAYLSSAGSNDIFLAKYDSSGSYLWALALGSTSDDRSRSVALDAMGNVYITGYFRNTIDFDPSATSVNLSSAGSADIFLAKYDANGNYIWAKALGGTSGDRGWSVVLDTAGNAYIAGDFSKTADFDPSTATANLSSAGSVDIFLAKYDDNGSYIWAKAMGGTNFEFANSVALDAAGNAYVSGVLRDTVDFDPTNATANLTSAGSNDIFLAKYDTNGNYNWAISLGGTNDDRGNCIALDTAGNVYITGEFEDTVDFDPSTATANLSSAGSSVDIFLAKYDHNGNYIWAISMGGTNNDRGNCVAIDSEQNAYISGSFSFAADFDPSAATANLSTAGFSDVFLAKYDNNGNYLWAKAMGGTDGETSLSVALDTSDAAYITGRFEGTADFNPSSATTNLISSGGGDIFLAKYYECFGTYDTLSITACDSLVSPSGNFVWYTSSTYQDTIPNFAGCDSIITLNLTINSTNSSVTVNNDTITANQYGAYYQWLNCDSSYSVISGATNQKYTPLINGSYACEISLNGCTDTTSCTRIIITDIDKIDLIKGYKLYPNPFTNQLIIEATGFHPTTTTIEILNLKGQLVYKDITINLKDNKVLNTADWSKGIYFVRLINEKGVGTFKLMHQ